MKLPVTFLLGFYCLVGGGCATPLATEVRPNQKLVPADAAVAIGRLAFSARRKVMAQHFELTAVKVPDGDKYIISAAPDGAPENGAAFFITLPPGRYRLTKWAARTEDQKWGDEDAGLSIEIGAGQVVCVGALYVKPLEVRSFRLDEAASLTSAVVRDECAALTELLRRRAPALTDEPITRLAQSVLTRRSPGLSAAFEAGSSVR